jgi:two-component system, OmpR family, sensor histidine kinase KdpD
VLSRSRLRASTDAGQTLKPYLVALGCVVTSSVVALLIAPFSSLEDEVMVYLLGDVFAALRFDTKTSVLIALGSILACDFLFIPPRMTFAWTDARQMLSFLAMLVVAVVVSGLSERLRHQEKVASRGAAAAKTLYELNVELAGGGDARQLAAVTRRRLQHLLGSEVLILLGSPDGALQGIPADLSHVELELAQDAWNTGFSTRASSAGYAMWFPVLGISGPLAVIGLKLETSFDQKSEQGLLLSACARELATAIERTRLAKDAHRARLDAETEWLRSSLLSAVSHDLKTPLAGIVASGTTLLEHEGQLDADASRSLVSAMVREGERLGQLLQNLLSLSRLESPTIQLRKTPEAVEDIVASALSRLEDALTTRQLKVDLPADLPWVLVEPTLVEQVLLNLLENALRYTPASSSIEVLARAGEGVVKLRVSDSGPGILEREREKVFEKFFRGSRAGASDGGAGLGLAICRAVVRAHGGGIAISERQGGGTTVEFTLPAISASAAWPAEQTEVSA